jgi:multidrug efflux pump subunit AcrA (membrane-fusion protein)
MSEMSQQLSGRRAGLARRIAGWAAPPLILAAAIGGFLALGSQPPPARKLVETPAATPVRSVPVQRMDGRIEIDADGVVVPLRELTLAAEVAGRVLRKADSCRAGQFVRAGAVLFEIDPRDYELAVQRLEGELRQAGLTIEEIDEELAQNASLADLARRQVALSRREVERLEGLKANRIVTETELERALREELSSANALSSLEGQKRVLTKRRSRLEESQTLAATMLEQARLDLSRTRVVAPVDGLIVDDKVEQDSFVAKGAALVTLEDTSAAEVKTTLRMDELAQVWGGRAAGIGDAHDLPDTPVKVSFALGDKTYEWDGVLNRQEGRGIDEKTRTLPCRVLVPEPGRVAAVDRYGATLAALPPEAPRALMRGMFVDVRVKVDVPEPLLAVPQDAVRPSGELFLVREGRLAIVKPRPFHVGGGAFVVRADEGLVLPSDRVVTSQLSLPRAGMDVVEAVP